MPIFAAEAQPRKGVHRVRAAARALCWVALMAGCRPVQGAQPAPTPGTTATPWPTLAPMAPVPGEGGQAPTPLPGPQLRDKFRVEVVTGVSAVFPLEGRIEQPVRIEALVLSGDLDPVIIITTSDGDRLASVNGGGPGQPEVIGEFQFPGTGYYELGLAASSGAGELGVSIYNLDPAAIEGGGVFSSIEEILHGSMDQPASYHIYRLTLERGHRIDLAATAMTDGLDLVMELYGPDGALKESRDDNVGKDPRLWNYMPSQTGTYIVVLSNFDQNTGDYELAVSPSVSGGEAAIGSRAEVQLEGSPRRSTWFTFPGRALDAVRIEARTASPGVDIWLSVTDPYGNRLASADLNGPGGTETLSLVQLPFDGAYQVEFQTLAESGPVEYLITTTRAADLDLGGRIAPSNFARTGAFDAPGTVLSYTFDASAGDLIAVSARPTVAGSDLDMGFYLYAPDGSRLASHDDDVGKNPVADGIELPLTGRYVVCLWNYGGTLGPFEVVIANPEAPVAPPGSPGSTP